MASLTAVRGSEPWRRRLYLPSHQVRDAARYAQTSAQNVGYWHYGGGDLGPTLPGKERRKPLSYLQLVEVAFVATFRALGVSLQRIRRVHDFAAQILQSEFPFAEYRWQTEGRFMLLDLKEVEHEPLFDDVVILGDVYGQEAWQPLLGDRFAEFDYEDGVGFAITWHVAGRNSKVAIDPRVAFGAPTVGGIPTWVIKGRYAAKETIEDILDDFGITEDQCKDALRFEGIDVPSNGHSVL